MSEVKLDAPQDGEKISGEQSSQSIQDALQTSEPTFKSYDEIRLSPEEEKSLFNEDQSESSPTVEQESQPQETPQKEEQPEEVAETSTKESSADPDEGSIKNYKIVSCFRSAVYT